MKQYNDMSDKEKKEYLIRNYEVLNKSFADIAKECNTYANKLRRDSLKFKLKIRNKSEAQKNALKIGKTQHPTKGKKRSQETKSKIGVGVLESWASLDSEELQKRKEKAKQNWEKMSEEEKQNMLHEANLAVREAGKKGSKLELYLLDAMLKDGYQVEFHKEQTLLNTKLQIDLFVPTLNVAIEVDGPSHFEPVWGDEALKRNKKYDDKKSGLIIGKGLYLIRIKQSKDFSPTRAELIFQELKTVLSDIKNKTNTKIITIGD
jgi:very-short-patch-repair endonuclease